MVNTIVKLTLSIIVFSIPAVTWADENSVETSGGTFTGEILTLLYVTDVRKSVAFYTALGFEHDSYYDYLEDVYRLEWDQPYPPEYAEMIQEGIRIGLTTADEPE